MAIVTISRGSYSRGKEVAEKVAERAGFECISRDVLIEASQEFNVPEVKLLRAVRDAPSVLDRFTFGKEKYVAYFRASLLGHLQRDNVVYHGFAGHYFVKKVSHVLKVRVLAEQEDRVKVVMEREGISKEEAVRVLKSIDEARRKWGLHLYGIDTNDPSLYDLVIHIKKLTTDDAADMICSAIKLKRFQTTAESQKAMDDLALAARATASLIESHPQVHVAADGGIVYVTLEGASSSEEQAIKDLVGQMPGVEKINVNVHPFLTPD
jgi:cytidylate kinase